MGNACGGGGSKHDASVTDESLVPTAAEKDLNKRIAEQLKKDNEEQKKVIKILLLGAGECGKSTVLKQMKLLHQENAFKDPAELDMYKNLVIKNCMETIQSVCQAAIDLSIPLDNAESNNRAKKILSTSMTAPPLEIVNDIVKLWKDKGIQRTVERNNEFHFLDSGPYFMSNIERIFTEDYTPTKDDIVRSRVATTGVVETEFTIDNYSFKMYDVGGQRGERKKWIHCFDSVTAIFFIASLSEYDQVLAEDRTRNRLKESLDLFQGIINLPWFRDTHVILFLNKDDLFRKKIATIDIGIYYPSYTGGCDYEAGLEFIREEYLDRNPNVKKQIYVHVTDATNTENISFVLKATKHIILSDAVNDIFA